MSETPAQFEQRRKAEIHAKPTADQLQFQALVREEAEAAVIVAQEKAEQEAATAEQARSEIVAQVQVQIAAGDATNQPIAKMQLEQRDQLERTGLLHVTASDSNACPRCWQDKPNY